MFGISRTWLLPLTAFLVMIAYLPGVMSVSTVGRWAVITVVGLPVVLTSLQRLRLNLATVLTLVLFCWGAFGLVWSVSPWDTAGGILHWLALLGVAFLAAHTERREAVWTALALGVSASLPFVLLQAVGFMPVESVAMAGFPGNVGLFFSSNVLGEVAVVAFILMVVRGSWLLALPALICAVLSGRIEVVLMLTVAGVSLPVARKATLIALAGVGFTLVSALLLDLTPVTHQLDLVRASSALRLQVWTDTIQNTDLLGWGLGTFGAAFPIYGFAHNELLQLGFELGITGAVLAIGLVTYALCSSTKRNAGDKVALLALVASGFVWAPLQDPATMFIIAALVGGLLGDRHRAEWLAFVQRVHHAVSFARSVAPATGAVQPACCDDFDLAAGPELATGSRILAGGLQRVG